MALRSDRQRRAMFRRLQAGGNEHTARDRGFLARAEARLTHGRVPLGLERQLRHDESRDRAAQRQARQFLVRSIGVGTGLAALGAGLAVAGSPRLQGALGRQLAHARRLLPVRTVQRTTRSVGREYLAARRAIVNRASEQAVSGVRWVERKVAGYTPGVNGPMPGPRARRVSIDLAENPRELAQSWMAQQASSPPSDLAFDDTALGYQPGLIDRIDHAAKAALSRGLPHPGDAARRMLGRPVPRSRRLFRLDIDPAWTRKFGAGAPRRARDDEARRLAQRLGYSRVRGLE